MNKTLNAVAVAIMLLTGMAAHAAVPVGPLFRRDSENPVTHLSAVPLDGSGASLAFTVATDGFALLVLTLNHSVNVSATAVTMTCTETPDGGTTNATLQSCSVASGLCTSNDASWSKTVAAAKVWPWRVDVLGFKSVTCTLAGTGAAAGDLITVKGRLVTK